MNVRTKRTAFTLLETLVSLGAATVLLIGLASSVRIVGRTLRNVTVDTRNSPLGLMNVCEMTCGTPRR